MMAILKLGTVALDDRVQLGILWVALLLVSLNSLSFSSLLSTYITFFNGRVNLNNKGTLLSSFFSR